MALAIKYRVSASFDLSTEIEPEGLDHKIDNEVEYGIDGVEDFNSNSYFSSQSVTCDGGQIDFVVEADDEDDAEQKLRNILDDGSEFEDSNGFTWVVESIQIEVEALEEEPPTVDEAVEILSTWVAENVGDGSGEGVSRVAVAAKVVLDDHARLAGRVTDLEQAIESLKGRISGMDEQIRALSDRLAQ